MEQGRANRTREENTELTLEGIRSIGKPYGARSVEESRVTSVRKAKRALQEGDVIALFITPPPKPMMHAEYIPKQGEGRTTSGYEVEPIRVVAAAKIHQFNFFKINWE